MAEGKYKYKLNDSKQAKTRFPFRHVKLPRIRQNLRLSDIPEDLQLPKVVDENVPYNPSEAEVSHSTENCEGFLFDEQSNLKLSTLKDIEAGAKFYKDLQKKIASLNEQIEENEMEQRMLAFDESTKLVGGDQTQYSKKQEHDNDLSSYYYDDDDDDDDDDDNDDEEDNNRDNIKDCKITGSNNKIDNKSDKKAGTKRVFNIGKFYSCYHKEEVKGNSNTKKKKNLKMKKKDNFEDYCNENYGFAYNNDINTSSSSCVSISPNYLAQLSEDIRENNSYSTPRIEHSNLDGMKFDANYESKDTIEKKYKHLLNESSRKKTRKADHKNVNNIDYETESSRFKIIRFPKAKQKQVSLESLSLNNRSDDLNKIHFDSRKCSGSIFRSNKNFSRLVNDECGEKEDGMTSINRMSCFNVNNSEDADNSTQGTSFESNHAAVPTAALTISGDDSIVLDKKESFTHQNMTEGDISEMTSAFEPTAVLAPNRKMNRNFDIDEDYDYDADDYEEPEIYDLEKFDFDHLSKHRGPRLVNTQIEYKHFCRVFRVLPNAYILRNLTTSELRLNGLCLGRERIKALCSALLFNSYVSTLEITEDVVDLQSMQYLVETFQENAMIQQLFLSDNNMGRQPVKLLLDFLCQSDQLINLGLSGNRLVDTDGAILANYISVTQNLNVIDLSQNQLETEAADQLSKALMKNNSIHTISLRWNNMNGTAVGIFFNSLVRNRSLVNLDMSWNGFNAEAVEGLGRAVRVNDVFTTLDISSCRITGKLLMGIIGCLKRSACLRNLTLGGNIFSGEDVTDALGELVNHKAELTLKELDLSETAVLRQSYLLIQRLMDEKDMIVSHGAIIGRHKVTDVEMLATMNPTVILVEFGKLKGMTLEELFEYMDDDGSGSLSREEIKLGLLEANIPLPERSLDLLIRYLDRDGDGSIDLQELMTYEQVSTKNRIIEILNPKESNKTAGADSENSRCRKILTRMLASREAEVESVVQLNEEETAEQEEGEPDEEGEMEEDEDGDGGVKDKDGDEDRNTRLPPIDENNKVTG